MRITNCHIHTFTEKHVPAGYPHFLLRPLKRWSWLVKQIGNGAALVGQHPAAEKIKRLHAFQKESKGKSQTVLLENVRKHYPPDTRFVILPMEMSGIGFGQPEVGLQNQHDELAEIAREYDGLVLPFATMDPRVDPEARELWRVLDGHDFAGIKLYPRLGFDPNDDRLRANVYAKADDFERHGRKGLPIMTHCSRGGVQGKKTTDQDADRFTDPRAFIPVLKDFPNLRICMAHFGGLRDWSVYANPDEEPLPDWNAYSGLGEDDPSGGAINWQVVIRKMIGSGKYRGLWTDISYTMFEFEEFIPFLRLLLMGDEDRHERLRQRVLFGSDFYMTRQEMLSEKAVCFRLRNALGEEVFTQIAETNPAVWLGEADDARPDLWQ